MTKTTLVTLKASELDFIIEKSNFTDLKQSIANTKNPIVKKLFFERGEGMSGRAGVMLAALLKIDKDVYVNPVKDDVFTKGYVGYFIVSSLDIQIIDWEAMSFSSSNRTDWSKNLSRGGDNTKKILENINDLPLDVQRWELKNKVVSPVIINYNVIENIILKPWQMAGVLAICKNKQIAYCADTGMGKTYTAVAAVKNICSGADKVLLFCPPAIIQQWVDVLKGVGIKSKTKFNASQLSVFGGGVEFDIVSISQLGKLVRFQTKLVNGKVVLNKTITTPILDGLYSEVLKKKYKMIIIDEAHNLKNTDNMRSPLMRGIIDYFRGLGTERVLALTATPMVTRIEDFYGLYTNIFDHPLRKVSLNEFKSMEKYKSATVDGYKVLKKTLNILQFNKDIPWDKQNIENSTLLYVAKDTGVEIDIQFIPINPSPELVKDCIRVLDNAKTVLIKEMMINTAQAGLRSVCAKHKKDWLANTLNKSKQSIVALSEYSEKLLAPLSLITNASLLVGNVPKDKRAGIIRDFTSGQTLHFLANKRIGGEGVDGLQHRSKLMIVCEPDFEIGKTGQYMGRLDRMNNTHKKVTYIFPYFKSFPVGDGSVDIEEGIISSMSRKYEIMRDILMNKGTEEEQAERKDEMAIALNAVKTNSRKTIAKLLGI